MRQLRRKNAARFANVIGTLLLGASYLLFTILVFRNPNKATVGLFAFISAGYVFGLLLYFLRVKRHPLKIYQIVAISAPFLLCLGVIYLWYLGLTPGQIAGFLVRALIVIVALAVGLTAIEAIGGVIKRQR